MYIKVLFLVVFKPSAEGTSSVAVGRAFWIIFLVCKTYKLGKRLYHICLTITADEISVFHFS